MLELELLLLHSAFFCRCNFRWRITRFLPKLFNSPSGVEHKQQTALVNSSTVILSTLMHLFLPSLPSRLCLLFSFPTSDLSEEEVELGNKITAEAPSSDLSVFNFYVISVVCLSCV